MLFYFTDNETHEEVYLTKEQVLQEVNAERNANWIDYTLEDLDNDITNNTDNVLGWIDWLTLEEIY